MKITLNNVSKIFDYKKEFQNEVIKSLSIEIKPNKIVGIVGSTGSGKSTLVSIIAGYIKPTYGEIIYNDDLIFNSKTKYKRLKMIHNKISISMQNPNLQLFKSELFEDVVYFSLRKNRDEEKKQKIISSAEEILSKFNIKKNKYSNFVFNLSEGEKRKVILSSMILKKYDVYIFDEPTANLDSNGIEEFVNILKLLVKQSKIVIIISHDIHFIKEHTDKVLIMDKNNNYPFIDTSKLFNKSKRNTKILRENNLII